jgi:GNAT superfamily N-acetyltransferase
VDGAKKYWTGEHAECWDLYVCGVHPEFQGKGVGRMLVNWGTDLADREGTSASVLCGEKNRGFYGKSGLVDDLSMGQGGGLALFRSAKAKTAQGSTGGNSSSV